MRILSANNFYYLRGGSERVFFDELKVLESHGHVVAPFSRQFQMNFTSQYSSYFASPISYDGVPLRQKVTAAAKLVYSHEILLRAGNLMDDFKPDVVHCHNIYGRLTTAVIDAARKRAIPVVMTLHDYKLVCPSYLMLHNNEVCDLCTGGKFHNCITRRCHKGSLLPSLIYTTEAYMSQLFNKYRHVNAFLCPSKFLLEKHRAAGLPAAKLHLVANFIDVGSFAPNFSPGKYILFAGRLSKEKGIATLLKAAEDIRIPIKIVGDGPLRGELEGQAKARGLAHVEFIGYCTGSELTELFRNAAFLVFPSEWYENAPMTILEAFAYGKPVIGSRIGGIPEMVREDSGRLFTPGNFQELRKLMLSLFKDRDLIEVLGRGARKQVEAQNDDKSHYANLLTIYQEAVLTRRRHVI